MKHSKGGNKTESPGVTVCPYCGANLEHFRSNGRILQLPCAIGTKVFEIYRLCEGSAWEIEEHKIRLEDLNKIGKTVFLSRDEAEKTIEKMNDE